MTTLTESRFCARREPGAVDATKVSILLLDENSASADKIRKELVAAGFNVLARTDNPARAVELATELRPQVVIVAKHAGAVHNAHAAAPKIQACCDAIVLMLCDRHTPASDTFHELQAPFTITELRLTIQNALILRRQDRREGGWMESALQHLTHAFITVDQKGDVFYMNGAAARMTGWNAQEARGKPLSQVARISSGLSRELDLNEFRHNRAPTCDWLLRDRAGGLRPVSLQVVPVDETRSALALIIEDQTRQRQLEVRQKQLLALRTKISQKRSASPLKPGAKATPLRVVLADDHTILRNGLAHALSKLPAVDIVAQASNGQMAVDLAKRHRPDVVIMDASMPVMGGIDAAKAIHRSMPLVKIIGLSTYDAPQTEAKFREAGAAACLAKTAPEGLVTALKRLLA